MTLHRLLRPLRPALLVTLAFFTVAAPVGIVSADELRTTPPATEAPEPPPATEAPAAPGTTPPTTDDSSDSIDWGPILVVLGLVLALIVVVAAVLSRKPQQSSAAQPRSNPQQTSILSTAQWIHDQLSLELMAATPATARQRWTVERSRLDNVAISAQQQWTAGYGEAWQRLGQSVSALGASLETSISLREQPQPDPTLVSEANQVVNRNRDSVQQLVSALWSSVQG